jgi:hypothetical protein
MNYDTLIKEFMAEFPELEDLSKKELDYWKGEDPPVHVFFGNVFNPVIKRELITRKNKTLLKKMFNFLENMSTSQDELVQEVAGVSVLESLGDDNNILKKARSLMGNSTLKMSYEIEKGLGRE